MSSRRTALAFALSLALHGALVIALYLGMKPQRPAAERPKAPPLRIALVPWRSPALPKKAESPRPVPPAAASRAPGRPVGHAAAPTPKGTAAPKRGLAAAQPSPEARPAPRAGPSASDSPRTLKLVPDPLPFAASGPVPKEEGGGHTIHNVPGELPDPRAVAEREGREAKAKVDGWINDELATLRVENGLVDSWFSQMHDALEKAAEHPPIQPNTNFLKQMAQSYLDSAQQYGKTGNPYGPDSPVGRPGDRIQGTGAEDLQRAYETGPRLRGLGGGRFGTGLLAVVEIQQSAEGKLLGTVLLESSGNTLFDDHVLKSAPIALSTLPAAPAHAAGVHANGIRTTWSFEGRVSYSKKKLSDLNLAKDGLYLAGMVPLSLLTGGHFDETTGQVDVLDLRHPEFTCKVKLLKVY